jgi:hypothetical protein
LKAGYSLFAGIVLLTAFHNVEARGVSPYLPLQMSPDIERQIERVLILAGKPTMRRPIAAATVLDALPRACAVDRQTCEQVRRYLQRYMKTWGVTTAEVQGAVHSGDSDSVLPNSHGDTVDSPWRVQAQGFWQPNDHVLVSAGGIAYDDDATPTGSLVSLGFDWAQLDVGFRDHWLSPLSDSSSLVSTEAPTMPSVTLSNYEPISPLGLSYEVFAAEMSKQDGIAINDTVTSGKPRLAGLHGAIEPAAGYALAITRIAQYGGGARNGNAFSDFKDAIFGSSNTLGTDAGAENRLVALTSSIQFPGKLPLAVHAEYSAEDNAYKGNKLLGATNFSLGIDLPLLFKAFDLTMEVSEWQNDWYVHSLYPLGLTNDGRVIGHWFGDQRIFGDAIGGSSQMLRAGWRMRSGGYVQARYRTSKHDSDWRRGDDPGFSYDRMHSLGIAYSGSLRGWPFTTEIIAGQDPFGDSFARLTASVDLAELGRNVGSRYVEPESSSESSVAFFVDAGAYYHTVRRILASDMPIIRTESRTTPHIAIGVRRKVSARNDLGVRVEVDQDVDGYSLWSFRAIDYRFRWARNVAFSGFFGAGRYDIRLPAYGYYWGLGVQYTDVMPKWDIGLDARHHEKLGRDKTLPNDPPSTPDRTRMFFDMDGFTLSMSRRF